MGQLGAREAEPLGERARLLAGREDVGLRADVDPYGYRA
jgi:hypothetical protein